MENSESQKVGLGQSPEKTPQNQKQKSPEQRKAYLIAKKQDLTEVATALEKKYQRILGQIEIIDEFIAQETGEEVVIEKKE